MGTKRKVGSDSQHAASPTNFQQLALRALNELASNDVVQLDQSRLLDAFCMAFTTQKQEHRQQVISYMRKMGIENDEIIDKIIPKAARRIGEQWVKDELSFAEVTIGAARMQDLARELGGSNEKVPTTIPLGFSILLIIPKEEQHTMGAFVAADQFRRLGLWVHLAIAQDPKELERTVSSNHFTMIGVSAASRRSLQAVSKIIDVLKEKDPSIPLILGGNIVNLVENIETKTRADLVTSNPRRAISFCGLPSHSGMLDDPTEII